MRKNNELNIKNEETTVTELYAQNLTYNEELKRIAERFNMTESHALKFVIHEIYKSKCSSLGLTKALELLKNYDEDDDIPEDIKPIDKVLSHLYEVIGVLETIEQNYPF